MFFSNEQLSAMTARHIQAQFTCANAVTETMFDQMDKLARLNVVTVQKLMENSQQRTIRLFDVEGATGMLDAIGVELMNAPEQATTFLREVDQILADRTVRAAAQSAPSGSVSAQTVAQQDATHHAAENFVESLEPLAKMTNASIPEELFGQESRAGMNPRQAAREIETHMHAASARLTENVADVNEQFKGKVQIKH